MASLQFENKEIEGNENLRKEARDHFIPVYREDGSWRPNLNGLSFPRLDEELRLHLESEFTEEEIFQGLKACVNKAPGLDRFNMGFLLEFWDVLKGDVMAVFKEFHTSGKFVKILNSTFIVLIPKVSGASNIKKFRPISLVGSIYKLIAKVLTRRMASVLDKIIGECQHAFVGNRQILDVVLNANEVVDEILSSKRDNVLCKLDMAKVYDHIS